MSSRSIPRAVVAGHLCLDVIPIFEHLPARSAELFSPGRLFPIESTLYSGGGAVANTGGALLALGVDTRLVARIGDDGFGTELKRILAKRYPDAAIDLRMVPGEGTSYSIIITAPGLDRIFFHSSGANDSFTSDDVSDEHLAGCDLLHFGYPPAMRAIYENNGEELLRLLKRAKEAGLATSLDLAYPQPGSRAAMVDWARLLERVLPWVDIFMPAAGELEQMLATGDRGGCGETSASPASSARPAGSTAEPQGPTTARLREASGWVLGRGCPVCALKIGEHGLYVRTTGEERRIAAMGRSGPGDAHAWAGEELIEPCFVVEPVGTTGAGDVTIAGFLAGFLRGMSIEETTRMALAAGAASVESVDGAAGVPDWESLCERIGGGWARRPNALR